MGRRVVVAVVALQLLVAAGHGTAHAELGVTLPAFLTALVAVTTFLGPAVGAVLTWRGHPTGPPLVAASLVGALALGGVLHFVLEGPDNVAAVAAGAWGGPFRWTAATLAGVQAVGVVVAAVTWRRGPHGGRPPGNP